MLNKGTNRRPDEHTARLLKMRMESAPMEKCLNVFYIPNSGREVGPLLREPIPY